MAIVCEYHNDCCTMRVDGALTIYDASEAKERLVEELDHARELDIDLSAVSEFDTAGVQLLLLLKREAGRRDKPLRFHGHSKAVLQVIDLYRLGGVFGDPVVLSGTGAQ